MSTNGMILAQGVQIGSLVFKTLKNVTGTVTVTNGDAAVTGSGTNFDTALSVGQTIQFANQASTIYTILSITDATNLTLTAVFTGSTGSTTIISAFTAADQWSGSSRYFNANTGATGAMEVSLPSPASPSTLGDTYLFAVTAAQYLRIDNFNTSTTINLGTTASASGGYVRSNVPGAMLEIIRVSSTQWFARVTGDWTIDS